MAAMLRNIVLRTIETVNLGERFVAIKAKKSRNPKISSISDSPHVAASATTRRSEDTSGITTAERSKNTSGITTAEQIISATARDSSAPSSVAQSFPAQVRNGHRRLEIDLIRGMEISMLKSLLNSITCFSQLSSCESVKTEPVRKYYVKTEEILKLLKTILDAVTDVVHVEDEMLQSAFVGLLQFVDEIRELCENWQPLMSKIYFVLQVESLISKIRAQSLQILELLKSSDLCLAAELSAASTENLVQKIQTTDSEQTSLVIKKAIKDHVEGPEASSDDLAQVADRLGLKSNQELLIEAVALEKLKENAEQAEKSSEVEDIDQMIGVVTHMHDLLVSLKQSELCNPVPIPADFCCPLSLELMTDPVIVASGQTYERAFIRDWIDLGLTVCPKTRQTLAHTNLIPNYTVKALIASWCDTNNVKLPDPVKITSLNAEAGGVRRINSCGTPDRSSSSPLTRSPIPSPSHPRSFSDSFTANGHVSDAERDDRSDHSGERNPNLNENPPQGHNRNNSASSTRSNSNLSQGTPVEGSDVSGELAPDPRPATANAIPHREPDFPSRLDMRARGQALWRRPTDRFSPRLASSSPAAAAEMRPELLEIENQVKRLVEDLKSESLDAQRNATSEIRLLAKHNMDNRIVIAGCGAIGLLVGLLRSPDLAVQENAVTALLNLSINDNNKSAIANAGAIEPLIHVLEHGSPEAKENSAATLFSLSVMEENKVKIGRSGAIKPLVDLLGNGTPRGKKDAATALFNLSINHENKARIVQAGAVRHLVELMDPAFGMVDKAVAVLSNLATIHEGRAAIGQEEGIPVLVEVVELGSGRGKENAAAALLQLCTNSSRFCNRVLQEGAVPPLVALSQSGTPRAREKAQQLLTFFRNQRHGNSGRG
ncbi:RING/U-box superfamily protein with ARM repeat domain [Striga asiatica]|uniref:RING-type E3 ubiquitin transferase n=1 Tax=Striga asiatica TaxID=4170 RepID=A0A5A7RK17_STRAF|nr:RING/U-box superfamily protein with ARM repeat domain [Striga asiatica]